MLIFYSKVGAKPHRRWKNDHPESKRGPKEGAGEARLRTARGVRRGRHYVHWRGTGANNSSFLKLWACAITLLSFRVGIGMQKSQFTRKQTPPTCWRWKTLASFLAQCPKRMVQCPSHWGLSRMRQRQGWGLWSVPRTALLILTMSCTRRRANTLHNLNLPYYWCKMDPIG